MRENFLKQLKTRWIMGKISIELKEIGNDELQQGRDKIEELVSGGKMSKILETLCYSDYEIIKEMQSQIDPSKTISKTTGFICPSCKERKLHILEHDEPFTCRCGLNVKLLGNALECLLIK
jgi:hypothetical protein